MCVEGTQKPATMPHFVRDSFKSTRFLFAFYVTLRKRPVFLLSSYAFLILLLYVFDVFLHAFNLSEWASSNVMVIASYSSFTLSRQENGTYSFFTHMKTDAGDLVWMAEKMQVFPMQRRQLPFLQVKHSYQSSFKKNRFIFSYRETGRNPIFTFISTRHQDAQDPMSR